MATALTKHDALLHEAIRDQGGHVVKTTGDGVLAAFSDACDAVNACLEAQRLLRDEPWPTSTPIRVRMALHTGGGRDEE
jgi:class 3 adenylate cyclase